VSAPNTDFDFFDGYIFGCLNRL